MGQLNGWAFPVEVDEATGRVKLVEDDDCVRQDIRLIVQTDRGERKMRPNFGAGLNRFLFQNVDLVLVNRMSETLAQSTVIFSTREEDMACCGRIYELADGRLLEWNITR